MQAGDTLIFIEPFDPSRKSMDRLSDPVDDDDVRILTEIVWWFIKKRPQYVHTFQVSEAVGVLSMSEASYRIDMPDESYLHIAVFTTEDKGHTLEIGVSLGEHSKNGTFCGGYTYLYDAEGVHRSTVPIDSYTVDDDEDDPVINQHFMVSDLFSSRSDLLELRFSDDQDVRQHGESAAQLIEEELEFDTLATEMGIDNQPPYPGELEKVQALIWDAKPFPLHHGE